MRQASFLTAALALVFISGLLLEAAEVDVSGDWTLTMVTPRGEMSMDMAIVQEGEKISVTMKSPRGDTTGEGTIKGNEIEWAVTRSTPRGEFTTTYKGTVEGDTMKGTVEMFNQTVEWKATRKK